VLRAEDPRVPELLAGGWATVAHSWGAHVAVDDALVALLRGHLARSVASIHELSPDRDAGIVALDELTRDDYPRSAATRHDPVDAAALDALRADGVRFFGAVEGERVIAMTALRRDGDAVETRFTAVAPDRRRRGLAVAMKATAMLEAIAEGATRFGTGGSALNVASIRMNEACGYVLDERWVTLERPTGPRSVADPS